MAGAVVAVLALAAAASVAIFGLELHTYLVQHDAIGQWNSWKEFQQDPATARAVARAQGVRGDIDAKMQAATTGAANVVLVGSYRNLSFVPGISDVDVKVTLEHCDDYEAATSALVADGFTHMYTAELYALFRKVHEGLHIDVSVSVREAGKPDPVLCAAQAARDTDLRGFLVRQVRQGVKTGQYVAVRKHHSE